LQQREIALAFLRAANRTLDRIAGLQREAADLRGRNIDIVRAGQVIGIGRAQEAEAILKDLDDALADDLDLLTRQLLEDREHQLLLAQHAGILDLERLGKSDEIGRRFALQFLELHFLHENMPRWRKRGYAEKAVTAGR